MGIFFICLFVVVVVVFCCWALKELSQSVIFNAAFYFGECCVNSLGDWTIVIAACSGDLVQRLYVCSRFVPSWYQTWTQLKFYIFVVVLWINRLSQSTERLPALWGQRAGAHLVERGSSDGAVQPEPGRLRPALLTVSGLQVSRLRLLSLPLPQLQLRPLLSPPLSKLRCQYRGWLFGDPANDDLTGRGQTAGVWCFIILGTGASQAKVKPCEIRCVDSFKWALLGEFMGESMLRLKCECVEVAWARIIVWRAQTDNHQSVTSKQSHCLCVHDIDVPPVTGRPSGFRVTEQFKDVTLFLPSTANNSKQKQTQGRRRHWHGYKSAAGLQCCFYSFNYNGSAIMPRRPAISWRKIRDSCCVPAMCHSLHVSSVER